MELRNMLLGLAEAQHGLLTLEQCLGAGLTERQARLRAERGEWIRVHRGVYRIAGVAPTPAQQLLAGCLATGGRGLASHRSAAGLWRLPVRAAGPEILVQGGQPAEIEGVIVRRTDRVDPEDRHEIDGIPVTALPRTLLDLGAVVAPQTVEAAMEDAVLRLGMSLSSLRACLDRLGARGRNGCGVLRSILDARDPALAPTDGELESRLARLIRRYGLPEPVRQFRLEVPGRPPIILDFAYPLLRLGIEADSRRWHAGRLDVQRNSEKQNTLTLVGWHLLRFTWFDVTKQPDRVANDILRSLSANRRPA
jgi:very-short-patch-repair endonuclease